MKISIVKHSFHHTKWAEPAGRGESGRATAESAGRGSQFSVVCTGFWHRVMMAENAGKELALHRGVVLVSFTSPKAKNHMQSHADGTDSGQPLVG